MVQVAEKVAAIPQIPNGSSNVHSFKQPGQEEDHAREHTETLLYPQQHTKKFCCNLEDMVGQKPSLALASTTEPEDDSPTSPTTTSLASSPCNPEHTANSLPDHCKALWDGEDQESDSDNSSEWSNTLSSNASCAQHLDGDDDAMTLAEVPFHDLQTALLFPSKQYQDGLHKLFAWLREIVQIEPDSFTVVDPYDFIQVLSFDSLQPEEKSKLDIILRLRCQFTHRPPRKDIFMSNYSKRILLPFL